MIGVCFIVCLVNELNIAIKSAAAAERSTGAVGVAPVLTMQASVWLKSLVEGRAHGAKLDQAVQKDEQEEHCASKQAEGGHAGSTEASAPSLHKVVSVSDQS